MARYYKDAVDDQVDRMLEVIYGRGVSRRQYLQLAKATGIPAQTIGAWKRDRPLSIPIGKALQMLQAVGATVDDWIYIATGKKKGEQIA